MTTLMVGVGGLMGVMSRYGLTRLTIHHESLLWMTAAINIGGSFNLGLLTVAGWFSRDLREGLGVGLLGGFTTFSDSRCRQCSTSTRTSRDAPPPTSSSPSSAGSPPRPWGYVLGRRLA